MERHIRDLIRVRNIASVLDVGAHYGEFGQLVRQAGYRGKIISFEPSEEAYLRVVDTAKGDPLWEVHRCCLGAENGTVEMQRFLHSDFNSLHTPTKFSSMSTFRDYMEPKGTETVPMRRLDDLLSELRVDPAKTNVYLKIDTQGHDLQVLKGASGFLSFVDIIQTELCALRLYQDVPTMEESMMHFRNLGFLPVGFYALHGNVDTPSMEWDDIFVRVDPASLANG